MGPSARATLVEEWETQSILQEKKIAGCSVCLFACLLVLEVVQQQVVARNR